MLNQKTKKAVRLLAQLIILISSAILPASACLAQKNIDSAKFKKEILQVLKKYGIKDTLFEIKVSSINQKGGQTALLINNYNGKVINFYSGDIYINPDPKPRIVTADDINLIKKTFGFKSKINIWYSTANQESIKYGNELNEALFKLGYNINLNSFYSISRTRDESQKRFEIDKDAIYVYPLK